MTILTASSVLCAMFMTKGTGEDRGKIRQVSLDAVANQHRHLRQGLRCRAARTYPCHQHCISHSAVLEIARPLTAKHSLCRRLAADRGMSIVRFVVRPACRTHNGKPESSVVLEQQAADLTFMSHASDWSAAMLGRYTWMAAASVSRARAAQLLLAVRHSMYRSSQFTEIVRLEDAAQIAASPEAP